MVSSASLQGGSSPESFLPAEVTLPAFTIPRSGLPHPASREITQVKKFLGIVHSRLSGKEPCRHGIQKQQLGPRNLDHGPGSNLLGGRANRKCGVWWWVRMKPQG